MVGFSFLMSCFPPDVPLPTPGCFLLCVYFLWKEKKGLSDGGLMVIDDLWLRAGNNRTAAIYYFI